MIFLAQGGCYSTKRPNTPSIISALDNTTLICIYNYFKVHLHRALQLLDEVLHSMQIDGPSRA